VDHAVAAMGVRGQVMVVSDLIPTNPDVTNHHNDSQLNPPWK
jgi:hypothetical protein